MASPEPVVIDNTSWSSILSSDTSSDTSSADGNYDIDHDTNDATAEISVYCDMSGGGWMRIIADTTTNVSDLAVFGDTAAIAGTFYNDATKGIGWGTNDGSYGFPGPSELRCLDLVNLPAFTDVKVKVSARSNVDDSISNSYGYLLITANEDSSSTNQQGDLSSRIVSAYDAWGDTNNGNQLFVHGLEIVDSNNGLALLDENVDEAYPGTHLLICMNGEQADYNQRYIQDLWIK